MTRGAAKLESTWSNPQGHINLLSRPEYTQHPIPISHASIDQAFFPFSKWIATCFYSQALIFLLEFKGSRLDRVRHAKVGGAPAWSRSARSGSTWLTSPEAMKCLKLEQVMAFRWICIKFNSNPSSGKSSNSGFLRVGGRKTSILLYTCFFWALDSPGIIKKQ